MKKLPFFFLSLLLLLSACAEEEPSTPEGVAKAYAEAYAEVDFARAKAYATTQGVRSLEAWEKVMAMDSSATIQPVKLKLDQVECTIQGDTAECQLCCAANGTPLLPLTLYKEQGKWKAQPEEPNIKN